jgi:hypothetical protein
MKKFARWIWSLRPHPVFPVLVFMLVSLIVKENFPFSHFAMYSNPTSRPLRFTYLADGEGEPLPILWHTGLSASRMTKKFNYHKGGLEKAARKEGRDDDEPEVRAEIKAEAGAEVLRFMRDQSLTRNKRELTGPLQLVEMKVSIEGDRLVETTELIAEIAAATEPTP